MRRPRRIGCAQIASTAQALVETFWWTRSPPASVTHRVADSAALIGTKKFLSLQIQRKEVLQS
jgi:hypothetical protein